MRFGETPEELESQRIQAWLDERELQEEAQREAQQPSPYYAQPGWWIDTIVRQAIPPGRGPFYVPDPPQTQQESMPWWAWALGAAGIVVAIRSFR